MKNNSSDTNASQDSTKKDAVPNTNQLPAPMILKLMRLGFRFGGRILPNIAGDIAYKLWFTPTRFKTPAREKEVLESAELKTHQINGDEIITFSWGEKDTSLPLVLLVHGWSGRGTQLGAFVQPLINAGYRVLSFDAPAHGKSSGKQTNIYEVADIIVVLQKYFGDINAVITHSFGGPCIAAAMQRGFITNRIISISPPATTEGLVKKFNAALHVPKKAIERMMQLVEKKYGKNILEEISMVNSIKDATAPGLVIHDSNDNDIPWQEGHAVAQAWNDAPFIKTSGLGHRRILRDPDVVEASVAFIRGKPRL